MNAAHLLAALEEGSRQALSDRGHRKHLGASLMGRPCARQLYYKHRWAKDEKFSGRMLRLFNRGHLEEARFKRWLEAAGATVYELNPATGTQYRISFAGGHGGGSTDGIAVNVPSLPPGEPCAVEQKTKNEKQFGKLAGTLESKWPELVRKFNPNKNGLQKSNPDHYVQLQLYMDGMGCRYGLYMAVNKDTDELYVEFVHLDPALVHRYKMRAQGIIFNKEAPPRVSSTPGAEECRFCPMQGICHLNEVPEVNCRTCWHATPVEGGTWVCERGNQKCIDDSPEGGCAEHLFNPYMLNVTQIVRGDLRENWIELVRRNGTTVVTGPNHVPSHELTL